MRIGGRGAPTRGGSPSVQASDAHFSLTHVSFLPCRAWKYPRHRSSWSPRKRKGLMMIVYQHSLSTATNNGLFHTRGLLDVAVSHPVFSTSLVIRSSLFFQRSDKERRGQKGTDVDAKQATRRQRLPELIGAGQTIILVVPRDWVPSTVDCNWTALLWKRVTFPFHNMLSENVAWRAKVCGVY